MKYFLIRYRLEQGSEVDWHRGHCPVHRGFGRRSDLRGKIAYRCMKSRDGADYFHIAATADEAATKTLGQRDYFKRYTERTKQVSGGGVVVEPLELVAETGHRA